MRLTHVHMCETYSHCTYVTNQTACALVNNFSLVICYFITIFFVYKLITIVTRHCVALQRFITLPSFSLSLFTLYFNNYVSYFVVKCDLAYSYFFFCDKVRARSFKVTSYVSPFLRSLWIFPFRL